MHGPVTASRGGRTRAYAPVDISSYQGQDPKPVLSLPFQEVAGCQLIVSTTDNATQAIVGANQTAAAQRYGDISTEISFWGSVSGFETMVKRQRINSIYGPAFITLFPEESYDNVIIKARLWSYGKPGLASDLVLNAAVPLVVNVNIQVRPQAAIR